MASPSAQTPPTESYTVACEVLGPDGYERGVRHVLVWPERVMTVNTAIRTHHRVVAEFTAHWRDAHRLMSTGCQPLAWCHITAQYVHGTNRKIDVGAEALAVKASIDGCVDGGVLPDDNPTYVRSVTYLPAVYIKGEERLILTLEGPTTWQ